MLKLREYRDAPPHLRRKNMQYARSLAICCRAYAGDNGGNYPRTLEDLCPGFLDVSDLQRLGFLAPGGTAPEPWIYIKPESKGEVERCPMIVAPRRIGRYLIVAYSDGSVLMAKGKDAL